jgi:hypothetical protein
MQINACSTTNNKDSMQVNDSGGTSGLSVLSPLVDLGLGGLQFGPHSTSVQTMQTKHCRMFF